MHFQVPYPYLWGFLATVLAALASWLLYRGNPLRLAKQWVNYVLFSLRFLVLLIVALLLLDPVMRWMHQQKEKPVLVLAVDNSTSMRSQQDSAKTVAALREFTKDLSDQLSSKFNIEHYLLGNKVRTGTEIDLSDRATDLASGLQQIADDHLHLNHAATVLFSDGIINRGNNPALTASPGQAPVFTIGYGDTLPTIDAKVEKVIHAPTVIAGNNYEVRVDVKALLCKGASSKLVLTEGNKEIFNGIININDNRFAQSVRITLPGIAEGLHAYEVKLFPVKGESNLFNNTLRFQVAAVKSKQQAVLVYLAPHPDVAALRRSLESNSQFDLHCYSLSEYKDEHLQDASLFVLHQVPGTRGEGQPLLQKLKNNKMPVFFVLGQQSGLSYLNTFGGLRIQGPAGNFNEAQAWYQQDFSLFREEENFVGQLARFAPLSAPYGTYQLPAGAEIMLYQQIGYVKTNTPLLMFQNDGSTHYAWLCGEGLWRWALQDHLLNGNTENSKRLVQHIFQWTAGKSDRSRFRVQPARNVFDETETIAFDAELYDDLNQKVGGKEINLTLKPKDGKEKKYVFQSMEEDYHLNAGQLPPGIYAWEARTNEPKPEIRKGMISVKELRLEEIQTQADMSMLRQLSANTGGNSYWHTNTSQLVNDLLADERMKTVIYEREEQRSLIDWKYLMVLVTILLTIEWVIRKWNGYL